MHYYSCSCVIITVAEANFALVLWPEENNCVSVVSTALINGPVIVGNKCMVAYGPKKKQFPAVIRATGTALNCVTV